MSVENNQYLLNTNRLSSTSIAKTAEILRKKQNHAASTSCVYQVQLTGCIFVNLVEINGFLYQNGLHVIA